MATEIKRQTALSLELGKSKKIKPALIRLEAYEALSEPFMISLDILASETFEPLPNLGLPASVACLIDGEQVRHFHGIVIHACSLERMIGKQHCYRLTLAPKTHFHEQGSNFRIFQNQKVRDIVSEILKTHCKINDFRFEASGGKRELPYCVQYGESDFAFVCRLLEEEGLYYFYEHEENKHTMVICDSGSSHGDLPDGSLTFNADSASVGLADSRSRGAFMGRFVHSWREIASSGAEKEVAMRDFDFTVSKVVDGKSSIKSDHDEDEIELFRWPGRFFKSGEGDALSNVLLESQRAQRLRFEASTQFGGIQVGFKFGLRKHDIDRYNRRYLIIKCRIALANEQYHSGTDNGGSMVEFTSIPDDVQFRAPIITPRPIARGPETAIVTGPDDEEIHVDEYGRVKVKFAWDRFGPVDDCSSCWLRVSQTGGLGNIIIPRVGHEVIVDFMHGNPDRPIVTGRVFNSDNMPVYKLPKHKTRALWRTKTYKQKTGSDLGDVEGLDTERPGANELRFEDAQGKEEVFVHAERDMNTRIRNCETHHVGNNATIMIGRNRNEKVIKNETIDIGVDRTEKVGGFEKVTIGKSRKVTVEDNDELIVGKEILIQAGTKITLRVGDPKMNPTEITLDTMSIKTISMMLEMEAKLTAKMKALMTTVEGKAMLTETGGIVMIN